MSRKKGDVTYKFSDEQIRLMESLSAHGTPLEDIAAELGVCKDTLERRMKIDDNINAAIKRGRRRAKIKARKTLFDMAFVDKSVPMAIFWAKTQLGWAEPKQQIEISTNTPTVNLTVGKKSLTKEDIKNAMENYLDKPRDDE